MNEGIQSQMENTMLKKMLFAAALTGLAGAVALPLQTATAQAADQATCREAAKAQYPKDRKYRVAFRKACKQAWKSRLNPQPLPPKA
jgi:hypothetical protein